MFLYEKKIIYLTLFWDGVKKTSAGFVKVSRERNACRLDIHIRHLESLGDGKYTLYLALQNEEAQWGNVTVKSGAVTEEKVIPVYGAKLRFGEKEAEESELCGILIRLGRERWISGYWQGTGGDQNNIRDESRKAVRENSREETQRLSLTEKQKEISLKPEIPLKQAEEEKRTDLLPKERSRGLYAADECASGSFLEERGQENTERERLKPALASKWEQLQRVYRKVHPFGDERLYLSIAPKDFIVLQAPYQRLVNNSFLLHGYYNYRHLILGPDEEIGTGGETCFYLGVPGTYFEREKMVAVMFGFEGFECAGPVEVGKFGYYMRRVEL